MTQLRETNQSHLIKWVACILVVSILILIIGCGTGSSSIAKVTLQSFKSNGTTVSFNIQVIPNQDGIVLGDAYSVVLMSRGGYLFSHKEVQWLSSEFKPIPSGERNIEVLLKDENRGLRSLVLSAPQTDKDIYPVVSELGELETKKESDKYRDAEKVWYDPRIPFDSNKYNITESEYQSIANKYVKVVIMTYDEYLKLSQAQEPD